MRVLVVGASGTIGRAIVAELGQRHEVIAAGRSSGDLRTDITDSAAIRTMFEGAGSVDAVVSATGKVKFAPFKDMGADDYEIGLNEYFDTSHPEILSTLRETKQLKGEFKDQCLKALEEFGDLFASKLGG